MISLRRSQERRHIKSAQQDTWLTFDPESHVDPMRNGFHALESLNEEHPGPEMGLSPHRQGTIEIITYVRTGALIHQQVPGGMSPIGTGEFHHTRGHNGSVNHSVNASLIETASIFKCCITLDRPDLEPLLQQKRFPQADREGVLQLVVSPDGAKASLRIDPDVRVYSSVLLMGHHLIHELYRDRGAWLHVVKGRILLQDQYLGTGDGAALDHEAAVSFTAQQPSEILLFDLA
jgi:hypothetical protein